MNQLVLLPILLPLIGAGVAMLLRGAPRAQRALTLAVLVAALGASGWLFAQGPGAGSALTFQLGGWAAPFGISLVADPLSGLMVLMVLAVMTMGMVYVLGSQDSAKRYSVFAPLYLTLTTGLVGVMLTGDTFNLFVFMELIVISGAALTAMSDDRNGTEAALKYFYISQLATAFLLLANGLIYAAHGTLNMADLSTRILANPDSPMTVLAMTCFFATFMIKAASVPFHFWQPDFHAAAPTAVSAMLSSVVVKAGVYGFIRMTTLLFQPFAPQLQTMLMVLGLLGVLYGGFGALGARHAKRMLAYSTIAQIGFMLMGIGWGGMAGVAAAIVFMVNHAMVKSAMLMLAGYLASRLEEKSAAFEKLQGMGKHTPFAGVLFFLGALALAGVPPMNGFVSKFMVFQVGIAQAQWPWLAVIGLASVLTLIYTMRAFQTVWFVPPAPSAKTKAGDTLIAPALLIAACIGLGVWGEPLVAAASRASAWAHQPAQYAMAVMSK